MHPARKHLILPALFAVFFFAPNVVYAAQDLFEQMDALMEAAEKTPQVSEKGLFALAIDHLDLSLSTTYSGYAKNLDDYDRQELSARMSFNTWTGNNGFSVHLDGWAEYGTQNDTWQGILPGFKDDSRAGNILEISELYTVLGQGELSVSLGRKITSDNTNALAPVSSLYHPRDLNLPPESKTLGNWQVLLEKKLSDETRIEIAAIPVFQDPKVPSLTSRWSPAPGVADLMGLESDNSILPLVIYCYGTALVREGFLEPLASGAAEAIVVDDSPSGLSEETGYYTRLISAWGRLDWFSSLFYGPNPYPLLQVRTEITAAAPYTIRLIKKNPDVTRAATGASTTFGRFETHFELLYNRASSGTDDDYLQYTAGFTFTDEWTARTLDLDRVDWRFGYAGETILDDQDAQYYYFSSRETRLLRNNLLFYAKFTITQDLTCYLDTDFDLERGARYHKVGAQYVLMPGLVTDLSLEIFDGNTCAYYGQWQDNDRINLQISYRF